MPHYTLAAVAMRYAYSTEKQFLSNVWAHRDEKLYYDARRDARHKRLVPHAFDHRHDSIQSSLYLTDATNASKASLAICPGSHLWNDEPTWTSHPLKHQVVITPKSDVLRDCMKIAPSKGDMIIWNSKLIHWGHPGMRSTPSKSKSKMVQIPLWEDKRDPEDIDGIKNDLRIHGFSLVHLLDEEEVSHLMKAYIEDMNTYMEPDEPFAFPPDPSGKGFPFIVGGAGGSASPPITNMRWTWLSKLHPKRIAIFEKLLGTQDICCSLDSVHGSNKNDMRLCSMASFAPKSERPENILKLKCIAAAWGRFRTTHWAAHGCISDHGYGVSRFDNKEQNFQRVPSKWKGWAAVDEWDIPDALVDIRYNKALQIMIDCAPKTINDCKSMIKPDIFRYL